MNFKLTWRTLLIYHLLFLPFVRIYGSTSGQKLYESAGFVFVFLFKIRKTFNGILREDPQILHQIHTSRSNTNQRKTLLWPKTDVMPELPNPLFGIFPLTILLLSTQHSSICQQHQDPTIKFWCTAIQDSFNLS